MDRLSCVGVSRKFGSVRAVVDVTVEFPEKGLVAIIGPNGAGKTTLLDLFTGFSEPDIGQIYLGDREITGLSPYKIVDHGIARSFQDLRLLTYVPALENLMLAFPRQRGEALIRAVFRIGVGREEKRIRSEARKILALLGLGEDVAASARALSYGQQKLLALGRCLATGARILLLDEPVAGLHPEMRSRIMEVLHRLSQRGMLVVFVEHDLALVRSEAEMVVAMGNGSVIAQGQPHEVLDQPEVIRAYLG